MKRFKFDIAGFYSEALEKNLKALRKIEGVKVVKRRSKPFYDVSISEKFDDTRDLENLINVLARLMVEADISIGGEDEAARQELIEKIKPLVEGKN